MRFATLTVLASLLLAQQPGAFGQDGSMESVWMDQPEPPKEEAAAAPALAPPISSGSTTSAPMCSLEEFKSSAFVGKGTWPGVGPFTQAENNSGELADTNQNRLKLDISSGQITRAELGLGKMGVGASAKDFLDIEMTADFLLEGLGVRPKKIAEFNSALEKSKDSLMSRPTGSQFEAGRYLVVIDRSKQAAPYGCLIAVNSLDASKSVLRQHATQPDPIQVEKPIPVATQAQTKPPVRPKATNSAINPTIDPQRDAFAEAIRSWQNIKKVAIRKRDTTQLGEILAGKALARQQDAIKWLVTNKKYYEMTPKGVAVDKYEQQGPGKKYLVLAQVKEFSRFIDEASGQVLKELDDRYTVNYTIEKIGDKFMITDSLLLSTGGQPVNKTTQPKR